MYRIMIGTWRRMRQQNNAENCPPDGNSELWVAGGNRKTKAPFCRAPSGRAVPADIAITQIGHNGDVNGGFSENADAIEEDCPPPEEYSYIIKVVLQNFLYHQHVSVSVIPQINCIEGASGSGKRAVLKAIASAPDAGTGREYIGPTRNSCSVAMAFVQGLDDRCPPRGGTVGDSVVIKRTVAKAGRGSRMNLKILNFLTRKTLSTLETYLTVFVQYLNFQVNNPLVLMTQEISTKFFRHDQGIGIRKPLRAASRSFTHVQGLDLGPDPEEGRASAFVFIPSAAWRHPKFGIPSSGFAHFHGFWVFHRLFYSVFPGYYNGLNHASFHPKKHVFSSLKNWQTIALIT